MRGSRGGTRVRTPPPPPLKNKKKLGFLSNPGKDPLKNHKATKPAFNVGPSWIMALKGIWPAFVVFGSPLPHQLTKEKKKKCCQSCTPSDKTFWICGCSLSNNLDPDKAQCFVWPDLGPRYDKSSLAGKETTSETVGQTKLNLYLTYISNCKLVPVVVTKTNCLWGLHPGI